MLKVSKQGVKQVMLCSQLLGTGCLLRRRHQLSETEKLKALKVQGQEKCFSHELHQYMEATPYHMPPLALVLHCLS